MMAEIQFTTFLLFSKTKGKLDLPFYAKCFLECNLDEYSNHTFREL